MNDRSSLIQGGEILFREGDAADRAYIIESGELEVSTEAEGDKVILCTLGEGDIIGEMGIIDDTWRTATAKALVDTRLIVVNRDRFTERIAETDPILRSLINILLDRYRSGLSTVKRHGAHRSDKHSREHMVKEYISSGIDKIMLESELSESISNNELQVVFQPILDTRTRQIAGFEALTRWNHPGRGSMSPGLFITLAEETNLIVPIGLHIFEQACRQFKNFLEVAGQSAAPSELFMSINVSVRQVVDPDFIGAAARIAGEFQVPTRLIKLEITESQAMDIAATNEWIEKARSNGFGVSLDDFGTGFASLEMLYKLKLDVAKIAQEFVKELSGDHRLRQLLRDTVSLIKDLGLEVVVEGIEDQSQLEFIAAMDCEYAQGYLVSKPVTADEIVTILQDA